MTPLPKPTGWNAAAHKITMTKGETIGALLNDAATKLGAPIDARALMLDCLGLADYASLLARDDEAIPPQAREKFAEYVKLRQSGQPVAYILGRREFFGLSFCTTPAALIPRPETEQLTEAALAHLPSGLALPVLDLGAGCGAVGITIAKHRSACEVLLADVAEDTLQLARQNAKQLGAKNVRFCLGDWFGAARDEPPFACIVCNPPYIADDDWHLAAGDLRFEPPLALQGGSDGLRAMTKVINGARRHLRRGGVLLLEHGHDQREAAHKLFADAGFCGIREMKDYAGTDRIMLAVNP
ncbi:MAG: peptide chain release factor N(5)-glutamine methyltransferase [Gammaproteobacteria bacterium]